MKYLIFLSFFGFVFESYSFLFNKALPTNPKLAPLISSSRHSQLLMSEAPQNRYYKAAITPRDVVIEAPSMNSRRITADVIIDAPMNVVWSILTDYNNLATHVPNLIQSYLVPNKQGSLRLFQEGAQKIIGFDFRASLVMDMTEEEEDSDKALKERNLYFKLSESQMFSNFDGRWTLRYHSRIREFNPKLNKFVYKYRTKLTYSVLVVPRGPVPVIALEWRIKEDVPVNLMAVKVASERRFSSSADDVNSREEAEPAGWVEWAQDETLGSYIPKTQRNSNAENISTKVKKLGLPSAVKSVKKQKNSFNQLLNLLSLNVGLQLLN